MNLLKNLLYLIFLNKYRYIEYHNTAMKILKNKYNDYVLLREKVQDTGPWKGQTKLAATISWKKAYESSKLSTLSDFI